MKIRHQWLVVVWLMGLGTSNTYGAYADRFVQTVRLLSNNSEYAESVVYGNSDYGYYELTELARQGQAVTAKLVPPGFRSPVDFFIKKKINGVFSYEKVGSQQFSFPLSAQEVVPQPLPQAENFTSRFFIGSGKMNSDYVIYVVNRFAEIVWVYSAYSSHYVNPLGEGKYAILGGRGDFGIVHFDGTVEHQYLFDRKTHHDLIYEGGDEIKSFSFEKVNFPGQPGVTVPAGEYDVGTILSMQLSTGRVEQLWSAWSDSLALKPPKVLKDLDHINSINHLAGKGYLISLHNLHSLVFVDESFRTQWSVGPYPGATISTAGSPAYFHLQHHATFLPNGNILIFDNGRKRSRVVELNVDPIRGKLKLVKAFVPVMSLQSNTHGSAYRLPNGNTVAFFCGCSSEARHTIEFDPTGKQIADMRMPHELFNEDYRMTPMDTIGKESYLGSAVPSLSALGAVLVK